MTTSPALRSPDGSTREPELMWNGHGGTAVVVPPNAKAGQVLRQCPIPALRKLHVEETDLRVVIEGSVGTYYLKQLAQETLMPVLGGRELLNRVTVVRT